MYVVGFSNRILWPAIAISAASPCSLRSRENARGERKDVIDHVLKRAGGDEEDLLLENLRRAVDALPVLLEHGAERAKNLLHTRIPETK